MLDGTYTVFIYLRGIDGLCEHKLLVCNLWQMIFDIRIAKQTSKAIFATTKLFGEAARIIKYLNLQHGDWNMDYQTTYQK